MRLAPTTASSAAHPSLRRRRGVRTTRLLIGQRRHVKYHKGSLVSCAGRRLGCVKPTVHIRQQGEEVEGVSFRDGPDVARRVSLRVPKGAEDAPEQVGEALVLALLALGHVGVDPDAGHLLLAAEAIVDQLSAVESAGEYLTKALPEALHSSNTAWNTDSRSNSSRQYASASACTPRRVSSPRSRPVNSATSSRVVAILVARATFPASLTL